MMNVDRLIAMLAERWAGKDMEVYFYEKGQEYFAQLKKDLNK